MGIIRKYSRSPEPVEGRLSAGRPLTGSALWFLVAALLAITLPVSAQDGPTPLLANEQLAEPAQESKAAELMETLRCIQCQGQSIADSDAPMAAAMRAEVRQRIKKGESADSIHNWMISRYGEWVSFEPAMRGGGLLLWLAPLLLLVGAGWLARGLFKRQKP